MKSKKATYTADTAPFYVIFAFIITFLFILFAIVITSYASDKVEPPEGLNEYLLYQRFLRSSDCFVYQDISGRVHSTTIDFNKFTQKNIENCYIGNNHVPAFKLKLSFNNQESEVKTNNWNDNKPLEKRESPYSILVYYQDKKYQGELIIEMQNV